MKIELSISKQTKHCILWGIVCTLLSMSVMALNKSSATMEEIDQTLTRITDTFEVTD